MLRWRTHSKLCPLRRSSWALWVLIVIFLAVGSIYSIATPILEMSDEDTQVATIWQVAAGHGLPVLRVMNPLPFLEPDQEAGQPPLYAFFVAAATHWVRHVEQPSTQFVVNPQADIGSPSRLNWNRNLFVHGPDMGFPWHGLVLFVHIARFLSVICGGLTVLGVYWLARYAFPERPRVALLAASFVAFDPMMLAIAAAADNDALAIALCTWTLTVTVRLMRCGPERGALLAMAVLAPLTALSKLNAAAVLPLVVGGCGFVTWRRCGLRRSMEQTLIIVVSVAVFAGWWYVRNFVLYGDPLALHDFIAVAGPRPHPLSGLQLLEELPAVWYSLWGVLGNFNITLPGPYYEGGLVIVLVAFFGLLHVVARWRTQPTLNGSLLFLGIWLVFEIGLLADWARATSGSTARLLFPAISVIALLLGRGWSEWLEHWPIGVDYAVSSVAGIAAALVVPLVILPAYPMPRWISAEQAFEGSKQVDFQFGPLRLLRITVPTFLRAGEDGHVTLYWEATAIPRRDLEVALTLFGPDHLVEANINSLPGDGEVLTTRWPMDRVLVDRMLLPVPDDGKAPYLGDITVAVYPVGQPYHPLQPHMVDASTNAVSGLVAKLLVVPRRPERIRAQGGLMTVAGVMRLDALHVASQVSAGSILPIEMKWTALGRPREAFVIGAELLNTQGKPIARIARQPHRGAWPTNDWVRGEHITDELPLPIPPSVPTGTYALWLTVSRTDHFQPIQRYMWPDPLRVVGGRGLMPMTPRVTFGNLGLLDVTVDHTVGHPGQSLLVKLLWQSDGPVATEDVVSLQLREPTGVLLAQKDEEPSAVLATNEWPLGWRVQQGVVLTLPRLLATPFLAQLHIVVYPKGNADKPIGALARGEPAGKDPIVISFPVYGSRAAALLPLPHAFAVRFGRGLELIGAEWPGSASPGTIAVVQLRWRCLALLPRPYTIFVHGLDGQGRLVFQKDEQPDGGRLPTTDWVVGQVVTIVLRVAIPPHLVAGKYALTTGWYEGSTGKRLLVSDGHSEVHLGMIKVSVVPRRGT